MECPVKSRRVRRCEGGCAVNRIEAPRSEREGLRTEGGSARQCEAWCNGAQIFVERSVAGGELESGARLVDGVVRGQRVRVSLSTRLGWRKGRWRVSVCWGATRYLAGGRRKLAARRVELAWEEKGAVGGSLEREK